MKEIVVADSFIKYNDGICMFPYSNYVYFNLRIENDNDRVYLDIFELYEEVINKVDCKDLVFINSGFYVEELSWLLPKLLSERYHISCMTIIDMMVNLPFNRYIIVTDYTGYKRRQEKFKALRENDVVILRTDNPREVKIVRESFIVNKIKGGLAFDSNLISHAQMIEFGMYDVGSYSGLII